MRARTLLAIAVAGGAAACAAHRPAGPPPRPKVAFTPLPAAQAQAFANPHEGPGGKPLCQRCHASGAKDAVPVNADAIALCSECHDAALMRHPFRVEAPPEAAGVPLVGRIVACHTCHEPHDVKARRAGLRLPYKDLCLACHARHGERKTPPDHPAVGAPGATAPAAGARGRPAAPADPAPR